MGDSEIINESGLPEYRTCACKALNHGVLRDSQVKTI